MQDFFGKIAKSKTFQIFIIGLIIVNSITIGIQTLKLPEHINKLLFYFDIFALSIYSLEAFIKISAYRKNYFLDYWNLFDFFILLICLIPTSIIPFPAQVARVLRVLRVFRVFRLISAFKQMRIVIEAIAKAIPGVFWTALLLFIIYYVFAVIGTVMFGENFPDWFGNLAKSFYTLFQIMTLESWSMGIARPVMEVYPYAWMYFLPFLIVTSFIIINVVVGIVIDTIGQSRLAVEEEQREIQILEKIDNIEDVEKELNLQLDELKANIERIEKLLKSSKT